MKTYDAYNRLATETDARGNVKTYSYEHARGLHLGTTYTLPSQSSEESTASAASNARSFTYNHLGKMTQVVDDSGVRSFGYNTYGERETDSLVVDGDTHLITELRDAFGRSLGYTYAKNGSVQQTVSTGYGADGRINSAGFMHGGEMKQFSYEYLQGSNLLHKLTKPNGMTLTQTYEPTRDLLTGIAYHRGSTLVAQRTYTYDILGRPTARNTARQGKVVNDSFTHDTRSELAAATVNGSDYEYAYDNIGNREFAQENDNVSMYESNALNQYTAISENGAAAFIPQFDADGNQTLIKTSTGIWSAAYNAENRPVTFTNSESNTIVECQYDSMGRRTYKKVTTNGSVMLHQRYLYRGYLQIACIDLTRSHHPGLWLITWDATQPVATRPLAIQKDGTWYTYGLDLTKNVCEVFGTTGYISTAYTYTPYGSVIASGAVTQPIQWSSEIWDNELGMVYYNWRYYNALYGVWNSKDYVTIANLYNTKNLIYTFDVLGLAPNINLHGNNKFIKLRSKTMTEYDFIQEYINEPEYFIIAAHGSEKGVYNPSTNMYLSPQELANMILENGYNYDKPIRIYACKIGRDTSPSGYLSMLANELSKRKPCSYKKGIYIEGPKELWYTTYDEDLKATLHHTENGELKTTTEIVFNENNEPEVKIELDYISNMHKVYID